MKQIIRYSLFLLIFSSLANCEDKPEKSFYGIPAENKSQILTGLLLLNGSKDTATGTVIDPKTGLEWKKCSQGQTFRSSNNDCQGGRATATLTTPLDQGRYGATLLNYCNVEGNDCNTTSLPMAFKPNPVANVISEAYNSCAYENAIRTNGYTNWRVPNQPELLSLAALGKVVLTSSFPNTPDDYYWSSWGNEQDATGATARTVSFSLDTIGKEQNISKISRYYVRCVRNTNGL